MNNVFVGNSSSKNWGVMYDPYSDFLRIFDKSYNSSEWGLSKKLTIGVFKVMIINNTNPVIIEVDRPHDKFKLDFEEMTKEEIIKFIGGAINIQKESYAK